MLRSSPSTFRDCGLTPRLPISTLPMDYVLASRSGNSLWFERARLALPSPCMHCANPPANVSYYLTCLSRHSHLSDWSD